MKNISLHICVLVVILYLNWNVEGYKTCWDNGLCVDLTSYQSNRTIQKDFWVECANLEKITYLDCDSVLSSYNYKVDKDWQNDTDIFTIYLYTRNEIYAMLNSDLRQEQGHVDERFYFTSLEIASGLYRLDGGGSPAGVSIAWRGTYNDDPLKYVVGKLATEPTFCSSSYTRSTGYAWAKNTILVIGHLNGKQIDAISAYPGEDEVLFSAGFQFKVLKVVNASTNNYGGYATKVYMYEYNSITSKYSKEQENSLLDKLTKADISDSFSAVHLDHATTKKAIIKKVVSSHYMTEMLKSSNHPAKVPASWTCEPYWYDMDDGCDCNCGAFDPDCGKEYPKGQLLHCLDGGSPQCSNAGVCEYSPVPANWVCDSYHFNASDGCDCGCGAYDPDCDMNNYDESILFNCKDGIPIGCNTVDGECEYAPPLPLSWSCDPMWYGTNDGCDCNCGAYDIDCDKQTSQEYVMNCPCADMTCSLDGFCTGKCTNYDNNIDNGNDNNGKEITVEAATEEEIRNKYKNNDNSNNNNDLMYATRSYYIGGIVILSVFNVMLIGGLIFMKRKYSNRGNYNTLN